MDFIIRPSRRSDAYASREIERRAGERFREVGLDWVADDEPFSIAALHEYARAGRSWVAVDDTETVIGYLLVDVVDQAVHIEQVSVMPDRQGRGVGRGLIDQARAWAVSTGRPTITLTTFTDVPWNRPLYEHLGFRVLAEHEIGPELRALRDDEAARGLDRAPRVCMRLECAND